MSLTFETVLDATRRCCEGVTLPPTIEDITIIRDVHGRIRLYLRVRQDARPLETAVISAVTSALRAHLGPYCAPEDPVWQTQQRGDALAVLHQQILDGRAVLDDSAVPAWYLLERHIAKQTWTSQRAADPPWSRSLVEQEHKPAIVTFFSFKGGSGRTSALAATAITMARSGLRVAVCDLDLEAPGLATLLFPAPPPGPGVVDYLLERPIHGRCWRRRSSSTSRRRAGARRRQRSALLSRTRRRSSST